MAQVTFKNLTPIQALTLAEWFEGAGEQHCDIWFEENNVRVPYVNVSNPNCIVQNSVGNVVVDCKTEE